MFFQKKKKIESSICKKDNWNVIPFCSNQSEIHICPFTSHLLHVHVLFCFLNIGGTSFLPIPQSFKWFFLPLWYINFLVHALPGKFCAYHWTIGSLRFLTAFFAARSLSRGDRLAKGCRITKRGTLNFETQGSVKSFHVVNHMFMDVSWMLCASFGLCACNASVRISQSVTVAHSMDVCAHIIPPKATQRPVIH